MITPSQILQALDNGGRKRRSMFWAAALGDHAKGIVEDGYTLADEMRRNPKAGAIHKGTARKYIPRKKVSE